MSRRWGVRTHSDDKVRRIAELCKSMPRCAQTDRELARRFHCGESMVRLIAAGWHTPKGAADAAAYRRPE